MFYGRIYASEKGFLREAFFVPVFCGSTYSVKRSKFSLKLVVVNLIYDDLWPEFQQASVYPVGNMRIYRKN